MEQIDNFQDKSKKKRKIITIILIVLVVILAGTTIFLTVNYLDLRTNFDTKADSAVAAAKKTQADTDENKFTAREKEPNREFIGPDDLGRLTFSYPKTWSVYVNKNSTDTNGQYEAYLNPLVVPMVASSQVFALRVVIEQKVYSDAIKNFDSLVSNGTVKSSDVSINGNSGKRFDGQLTTDMGGSVVMFKVRDKTLSIFTDGTAFLADYNAIISTIKFNQ
jgi:cytoskeletal protein RodZ